MIIAGFTSWAKFITTKFERNETNNFTIFSYSFIRQCKIVRFYICHGHLFNKNSNIYYNIEMIPRLNINFAFILNRL